MDDYKIALGALLDANAKGDIDKQLNAIKDLSVTISKATLSNDVINDIKRQLTQNGIDLKLVFGNVNQITNQAKQTGQQIGQQIQNGISSVLQKGDFKKSFLFSADKKNNVAKDAQAYFRNITNGIVSVQERMEELDGNSSLKGFTVNIKNAKGEVESLRYSLRNITDNQGNITGQKFQYTGGSINDASAIKQIKDIENAFSDYTAKLSQFKSTNSEILSGLTTPLSDFETKLAGLKNGTSTIDEVTNAYKSLNAEASNITKNFSRQLSPIDSAIRNLAKGEETISGLRAEFKGLNNAPKEINTELNKCARLLENVKKIESQEGRTENWSQAYRQWSDSVDTLQAKLKTLRKEQSNVASTQIFNTSDLKNNNIAYMSKVYNTIEKQMVEINRLAKAKDWQVVDVSGVEQADGKIKKLTLTVRDAEGALKKLDMQREKLQGNGKAQYGLMQVGDVKILETASQAMDQLAEKANKIQLSMGVNGDTTSKIEVLRNNFTKLGLSADEVKTKMSGVDAEVKTLQSLMNSGANNSAIVAQFEKLQTVLTQTQNNLGQTRSAYSLLATEQQRLSLANTIEAWKQKNTAATRAVREECDRYIVSLRDLNTEMSKSQYGKIQNSFKQAENSMRAMNRLGASLKNQWIQATQSFTMWLSASRLVMKAMTEISQSVNILKEVDTQLTEISKTNWDLTSSDLKNISMEGFGTASKYGKTISDYLSGVKDMSRAGYDNAEAMAELSVSAQGAGDMTAEIANKMIIATDKAYKLGGSVEELTKILDGVNWICDNNALTMSDLSEGMSIVGSTAASTGVDVNELTAALGTMAATTQQSGSEVARAFKAVLLNIKQVSDEEEGIDAEGLTKYERACNALGVSLKETKNGILQTRDAMEVLEDLSKVYSQLDANDIKRANLLNSVGGKVYHVIQKCVTRTYLIAGNV